MAHHEIYLLLRVLPEIYTFWNAATYHFMVILTVALLVGSTWITIKHVCSPVLLLIEFNFFWIRKFAAIVC